MWNQEETVRVILEYRLPKEEVAGIISSLVLMSVKKLVVPGVGPQTPVGTYLELLEQEYPGLEPTLPSLRKGILWLGEKFNRSLPLERAVGVPDIQSGLSTWVPLRREPDYRRCAMQMKCCIHYHRWYESPDHVFFWNSQKKLLAAFFKEKVLGVVGIENTKGDLSAEDLQCFHNEGFDATPL